MTKLDLVKTDKIYYNPPTYPVEIKLPAYSYIAIEGRGAPAGPEHMAATEAQFGTAYAIKFASKEKGHDFVVPKQEGLWWFDELETRPVEEVPREDWNWKLLIRMPDFIAKSDFDAGLAKMKAKKPDFATLDKVKFEMYHEPHAVQILHIGPYSTEPESKAKLEIYMAEHGLEYHGDHHEIYISDFRKTKPEKRKTILRYPVRNKKSA